MNAGNQQGSSSSASAKLQRTSYPSLKKELVHRSATARRWNPSETTRRAPLQKVLKAYLQGALHDGTYNKLHKTFRISQKGSGWLKRLKSILTKLGYKSWIYKEGKTRKVYALETKASFLDLNCDPLSFYSTDEQVAYIRGYFDAEGGVPKPLDAPFYIQFVQKNEPEMIKLQQMLIKLKIACGKIHNPSKSIDPNYWRFYVLSRSHQDFVDKVSSWHPRKYGIFCKRMMI